MNKEPFKTEDVSRLFEAALQKKVPTGDPMKKLRRKLGYTAATSAFLELGYGILLVIYPAWPVNLCLIVLLVFTGWGVINALHLRGIIAPPDSPAALLQEMQRYHRLITKWMRLQPYIGTFVYPFSIVAGGLLGAHVVSQESFESLLRDRVLDGILIVLVIVFVPITRLLGRAMRERVYGRYLDDLKRNIDELSN
jgi:hypothetical protein